MADLAAKNLTLKEGDAVLVEEASFSIKPGELVAVLGPNGAGKTSLVRTALGILRPQSGESLLDGTPIDEYSPMQRARRLSYLPQTRPLAWPASVRDVVALGRYAHGAVVGRLTGEDKMAVEQALEDCALTSLAKRATDTLSGGELARVHCARAFAAAAPLLIADEPVAALDPRHQYQIMGLIRHFVDGGRGALAILHDVTLAARFADRLIWMKDGRITADGSPAETLTAERLREIYGIITEVRQEENGPAIIIDGPA